MSTDLLDAIDGLLLFLLNQYQRQNFHHSLFFRDSTELSYFVRLV